MNKRPTIDRGQTVVPRDEASPKSLGRAFKLIISLLVTIHVLAVFAEPFRFFTQSSVKPSSEVAGALRSTLARYVEFMYLNHGYAFFAPNPGPSHLLRCDVQPSSMVEVARVRTFPDRKIDRPRLLYHRYFMLSEFYHSVFAPIDISQDARLDRQFETRWKLDRALYEELQRSIKNRFAPGRSVEEVRLSRIEHALPTIDQVLRDGWQLTDDRLYQELSEGERQP